MEKLSKKCKCDLSQDGFHEETCFNFPRRVNQKKFFEEYREGKIRVKVQSKNLL